MRLAKEQEARQSRQRVFVTVLRYRQQEEKLHRRASYGTGGLLAVYFSGVLRRQRDFLLVLRLVCRLQQEASCLVQVLQQQQQYMAFLRAEDQNFRQRSHEQHVTTFLCPCRKELF